MTNKEIQNSLNRALDKQTPDVLHHILSRTNPVAANLYRLDDQVMNPEQESSSNLTVLPSSDKDNTSKSSSKSSATKRSRKNVFSIIGSIAAVFVVAFASYNLYQSSVPQAMIEFDVNPSIALEVNRAEKVVNVTALNEDAQSILGEMNLKNSSLDDAVTTLVDSMVDQGYITDDTNSILISVDAQNDAFGTNLQDKLTGDVETVLSSHSLNGAVLSQTIHENQNVNTLAAENNISVGKASLITALIEQDSTLDFSDLAHLSINELNILLDARKENLKGVLMQGTASTKSYIGEEAAKQAAVNHVGANLADAYFVDSHLDLEHGQIVYELEFYVGDIKYECDVNALDGTMVKLEQENEKNPFIITTPPPVSPVVPDTTPTVPDTTVPDEAIPSSSTPTVIPPTSSSTPVATPPASSTPTTPSTTGYIGEEQARRIAFSNAGVSSSDITSSSSEMDQKMNRIVYKLEFETLTTEYDYYVDALTGDILHVEVENKSNSQNTSSQNRIGVEQAKSIALQHAGVSASAAHDLEVDLDDDGRHYDVEWEVGEYSYEYEIDAFSGAVLKAKVDD